MLKTMSNIYDGICTAKKIKFSIKDSTVNVTKSAFPADLVTFTGEILNGKLHFWGSVENKNANENRGKNRKISIIDV